MDPLAVTMAGVRLGDRFLAIGLADLTLAELTRQKSYADGCFVRLETTQTCRYSLDLRRA